MRKLVGVMILITLILAVMFLCLLAQDAAAAPVADMTPDLRCIRLLGCWYVPDSYVVSVENSQWVWAPYGTILGIGDWRILWDRTEWVEVVR